MSCSLPPPSTIAQHVAALAVGASYTFNREEQSNSTSLRVTITKIDQGVIAQRIESSYPERMRPSSHPYDGSGKLCPLCSSEWLLLKSAEFSDGSCGLERGTWACRSCSLVKEEDYVGYGSIFGT